MIAGAGLSGQARGAAPYVAGGVGRLLEFFPPAAAPRFFFFLRPSPWLRPRAASPALQRRSANERPCAHFLRVARAGSVRRPGERQPARLSLLRQGPRRRRAAHGRPSALRRVLLAFVRLAGRRPVWRRDLPAALDARRRPDGHGQGQGQCRLRPVPHPRRAVLHLP